MLLKKEFCFFYMRFVLFSPTLIPKTFHVCCFLQGLCTYFSYSVYNELRMVCTYFISRKSLPIDLIQTIHTFACLHHACLCTHHDFAIVTAVPDDNQMGDYDPYGGLMAAQQPQQQAQVVDRNPYAPGNLPRGEYNGPLAPAAAAPPASNFRPFSGTGYRLGGS